MHQNHSWGGVPGVVPDGFEFWTVGWIFSYCQFKPAVSFCFLSVAYVELRGSKRTRELAQTRGIQDVPTVPALQDKMPDSLTDEQKALVETLIATAVASERDAQAEARAELAAEVDQLRDRLAVAEENRSLLETFHASLGNVPEKGTAEEKELVFPRHYDTFNELPRSKQFRRGCERLDVGHDTAMQGFARAKYWQSMSELETLMTVESYLQDVYFAGGDSLVDDQVFRLSACHALNYIIAVLRRKRQMLRLEGNAQRANATVAQKKAARALRKAYDSEASDRLVSDPTLTKQLQQIHTETLKAEAKAAASGTPPKRNPPGGKRPEGAED